MHSFPVELARSIMNLELLKEAIIKKDAKPQRLCYCRKNILNNYIYICQLVFIRFTAKLIKLIDEGVSETATTSDLWDWYRREVYTKMFADPSVSDKMILIFNLLQDSLDTHFFETLDVEFREAVTSADLTKIHQLYDHLNEWMENYLLNISTLKIDCMKIQDGLLSEYSIVDNFKYSTGDAHDCLNCYSAECPANGIGHDKYYSEEEIHLYMSAEFDDGVFLTKYFDIISKYHNDPDNIKIIFDFILYDDGKYMFTKSQKQIVMNAISKFKTIEIINHRNINFDICRDEIINYLR